ncbi:glycosyltransferase family 2 protein [Methyloversatilis universalis]|uniref:glycosyltransferase family 2 protein n=1 Tax=Methyloversatilis universalis TaxID=378211 RepID=UPI00037C2CA6|nr:glycosyltransferase [Methyloversatilis universalis]
MKLSLILATVGRSSEVGRLIGTLAAQTDRRFELIVVDQNDDDRLVPHVEAGRTAGLDLQHLKLERPSLSGARNLGIRHASGDVIGFPDDDCWYEAGTVAALLDTFAAEPDVEGCIACWMEQSEGRGSTPLQADLSLADWRNFRGGDASSISLFFKRGLFDRLGGFDERFGVGQWYGAGEETDFVLRALASGERLAFRPNVRVHHLYTASPTGRVFALFSAARRRARGTGAIYAKHRLAAWVIFRGLCAPVLLPLLHMRGWAALTLGAGAVLGRIEGFLNWRRTQT